MKTRKSAEKMIDVLFEETIKSALPKVMRKSPDIFLEGEADKEVG